MRTLIFLISCLFLISTTATAQVYTQAGGSDDLTFYVYGDDDNGNPVLIEGLSASLSYILTTEDGITWDFAITISNDSSLASNLTGFGFDFVSSESISSVTVDDPNGVFSGVHAPGGFPNVLGDYVDLKDLDVCIDADGGGSCSGSSGGLVTAADEDIGNSLWSSTALTLSIMLTGEVDSIDLNDFGIRFQGFSYTPEGQQNEIGSGVGVVTTVPEPATWMMMIIGFGIVGAAARRTRRRTSSIAQTC